MGNWKDIIKGVIITLIGVFVLWIISVFIENTEIKLKRSLEESFRNEFKPIIDEIEVEKEKRIQLAVFLMKNNKLDIPTNLLTVYEDIAKKDPQRAFLEEELTKQLSLITPNKIDSIKNEQSESKDITACVAPFSRGRYLIAFSSFKVKKADSGLSCLAMTDDWMNILNSKEVKTGNVWLADSSGINKLKLIAGDSLNSIFYTTKLDMIPSEYALKCDGLSEFETRCMYVNDSTNLFKGSISNIMKFK